ncbi:GntR family transcriptional regulator [Oceanispirochaeta sp.]|jgi:DNA-binding GntR family transcriptional regulator|uniref:GntR family transcriptional regulator n=1 Tax=Oceanispirochaeta sp. TaxID=2035350 RepID=UPI002629CBF4|nr:GntR family transcriptional regulator [Oceanispirochaeta sp.]MDA3958400.1 GntR family transcriptional regulator [Oceanispirochaeta sp.]
MAKRKWGDAILTKTASETVYDILYRNIININLVPGTVMSEKEISEKMNVSRTPVREAFIRLSKEALVTVIPQKGSFVSRINLARVKEERFLRESLETSVLEELIMNNETLPLERLSRNLEYQKIALDTGETTRFMDLDDQFHSLFFELADRHMCFEVVMSFSSHYRRVRYLSMAVSGVSGENFKHHKELLHLIEKRDLEGAQETMKVHLRKLNIEENVIYKKFTDYFEDTPGGSGMDIIDEKNLFQSLIQ